MSVVLVTGASRGIGRAIVERFARERHHVIACARGQQGLDALAADVHGVECLACDIRDTSAVDALANRVSGRHGAVDLRPFSESIELTRVGFAYEPGQPVLRDFDLRVRKGEVLAVVGPSGGGKTTLANLIPRFYDVTEGALCIDGVDIRGVTLHSLRRQLALVTQQTILFNDTVRSNIAYGSQDRTDEEIVEAARAAYALDFIEALPQGFDTVIGESGARLSGGQQQRLSIARALLKDAPILILDEATSSLDTESEREVQRALENLMQNRTTIVIAHRLSTIKNADRIIVLKEGRLVEEGTHNELLALGGEYSGLYRLQFTD